MNLQITHRVDNDGEFCRTLYKMFTRNEESKCYRINYDEKKEILKKVLEEVEDYDDIYITDIAISVNDCDIMSTIANKLRGKIYLIDHHKHTLEALDKLKEKLGDKLVADVKLKDGDVYVSAAHIFLRFLDEKFLLPEEYNRETVYYVTNLVSEVDTFTFRITNNERARRVQYLYSLDSKECQRTLERYMKDDKQALYEELDNMDMTPFYEDVDRFRKAIENEGVIAMYNGIKVVILKWPKIKYKNLKPMCMEILMNDGDTLPICFMLEGDVYRLTSNQHLIADLGEKLKMGIGKPMHVSLVKKMFLQNNNIPDLPDDEIIQVIKELIEK